MSEHIPISEKEKRLLAHFNISDEEMDAFNLGEIEDIQDLYSKAAIDAIRNKGWGKSVQSLKDCFRAIALQSPKRGTQKFQSLIKMKAFKKKKKKERSHPEYERLGTLYIDEVMPHIGKLKYPNHTRIEHEFCGEMIYVDSLRYLTYKVHGTVCEKCGLKGLYFAIERHSIRDSDRYHLNLYGKNEDGKEVMMTMDHVIPKSKGGLDHTSNTVPMCEPCNFEKADNLETSTYEPCA